MNALRYATTMAFLVVLGLCSMQVCEAGPLEVVTTSLPSGTEMVPYSAQLRVKNGVRPYTWLAPDALTELSQANSFKAVGSARGWHADDDCWLVTLPFEFPFFGTEYTNLYVSSNGTITVDGPFTGFIPDVDTFMQRAMICALWNDLSTEAPDDIRVKVTSGAVTIYWDCHYPMVARSTSR